MTRSRVDLPEPLSPTSATDSPCPTLSEIPRRACSFPSPTVERSRNRRLTLKVLVTSRTTTDGGTSSAVATSNVSPAFVEAPPNCSATSSNGRTQALTRPAATAIGSGGAAVQSGVSRTQRGANAHPGSGDTALGTEPANAASR